MSKLIKEYFEYQHKFVKKYGPDTIVLMQVGSFYEFYGLNTEKLSYKEVDASLDLDNKHLYTVAKLLGFSIAKKTNNALMAGVPKYAIDKHVKKLLDNNLQQDVREVEISQVESDLSRDPTSLGLLQGFTPGFVIPAVPSISQQGGSNDLKPIKDILAKFESNGDYDVANVGTAGRVSTIKVSNKTIGELRTYWALPKENSNRVFAMGRYQFIPQSLVGAKKDPFELLPEGQGGILRGVGLLDKDLFSPANQEKIVDAVLTTSIKRPKLGAYISAANNGSRKDLEDAIQDIGNEWASMPVIFDANRARVGDVENGSGNTAYFGGVAGNPSVAKVTVLQMVKAVIKARENYTLQRPEFVPSYYL